MNIELNWIAIYFANKTEKKYIIIIQVTYQQTCRETLCTDQIILPNNDLIRIIILMILISKTMYVND